MTEKRAKIILGIDPGSNLLGYAFIKVADKNKPRIITMGTLDMRKYDNHSQKLAHIFTELQKLIALYEPTDAAIEAPFYGKNVQSMLKLGRAQGVAMVAISEKGLVVEEYSPKSVKKAVTGNGNASKEQVARMFPHIIDGEINCNNLDATDALGVAFCHHIQTQGLKLGQKKHNDWGSFLKDNPQRKAKL
jgi:crossover junction endodeoxyribonuclease RuvC